MKLKRKTIYILIGVPVVFVLVGALWLFNDPGGPLNTSVDDFLSGVELSTTTESDTEDGKMLTREEFSQRRHVTYEEVGLEVGDRSGNFLLTAKEGGALNYTLTFVGEATVSGRYYPLPAFGSVSFKVSEEDVAKLPVIDSSSAVGEFCVLDSYRASRELLGMSYEEMRELTFYTPDEPVDGEAAITIKDFTISRAEKGGCGESSILVDVVSRTPSSAN